jgi:hypothetical protein
MKSMAWMGWAIGVLSAAALTGCGAAAPKEAASAPYSGGQSGTAQYPGGATPTISADAPPPPPAAEASRGDFSAKQADKAPSAAPSDRPGLGTEWGETRNSHISTVPFVRADSTNPIATAALFYNDAQGAKAMSGQTGFRRWSGGGFNVANGLATIGLKDASSNWLSGFVAGDRNFTVGEAGNRYVIVVHNNTNNRLEIVLSVDGLDVLDGKAASFSKRGYLVDPQGDVEVDGFRQSTDTVAAFRFGSVRDSYAAQKTGDARNVGVIGLAIFHERGTNPVPWNNGEVQRRNDANPFPGQFATPPPGR